MTVPALTKTCTRCGECKNLDDFNRRNLSTGDGRQPKCRACESAYKREHRARMTPEEKAERQRKRRKWARDNPEKTRLYKQREHIKSAYGLEWDDYQEMIAERSGRCGLCGNEAKLQVDHDHVTGEVRGLLCGGCNRGLGLLGDDPEGLRNALRYLEGGS